MAEGGMFCTWQGDVQTKTYVVTADCGRIHPVYETF